jgi:hypothetical protein
MTVTVTMTVTMTVTVSMTVSKIDIEDKRVVLVSNRQYETQDTRQ